MIRKRVLSPGEKAEWRKIARSVTPIDESRQRVFEDESADAKARPTKPGPQAKSATPARKTPKIPTKRTVHPHPPHHHQPVPVDRGAERRHRRGKLELDARIDLHGLTQAQALSALTHFLRMAWREGYRNVLVITGKGIKPRTEASEPWEYPEEPGVLRRKLPEWLSNSTLRQWVSGYSSSHARHGGAGAFYVTLRTRQSKP